VGFEELAIPLGTGFAARTVREPDVLMIRDTAGDAQLGASGIRFYAGAPITTRDGHVLGALCVMDRKPGELTDQQIESLRALSRQAVAQLELRRLKRERTDRQDRQTGSGAIAIPVLPHAEEKS
jgi:GAF domain-containing protein